MVITLSSTTAPIATTTTATLAHTRAHANVSANASMLLPEDERFTSADASLSDELHAQYSFIAVIVLMSLFLAITVSATGFVLAFCKKKNTVFSLQKCEQDSQFEMDDLENTDIEFCHEDLKDEDSVLEVRVKPGVGEKKRSLTFPLPQAAAAAATLAATTAPATTAFESRGRHHQHSRHQHQQHAAALPHRQPQSPAACTPLVPKEFRTLPYSASRASRHGPLDSASVKRPHTKSLAMTRSFTVAAIHHTQAPLSCMHADADCDVSQQLGDAADTGLDDVIEISFGGLGAQDDDGDASEAHDSDTDEHANDQTVALLRC